jgi:predicted nuclease of predicted toxin-antitoxin system
MKFLLDMGLSPRTARFLREQGHDAVHLHEQRLSRLPDTEITRKAAAEGRIILTFDLDFSRIVALQRLAHPSVVLFRLEEFTTDGLNALLLDLVEQYGQELDEGAIVVVEPGRVRTRSLPIW